MNWSDLGFRSHCILSGYFLLKGGSAFPLLSDLTSPRCRAELIGVDGGQKPPSRARVFAGETWSSWLTQAGRTAAGLPPGGPLSCSSATVWGLQPRRLSGVGSEQWEAAEGVSQRLPGKKGCPVAPFLQTWGRRALPETCPDHPPSALTH